LIKSPIKYFGGKTYLAERICKLFPPSEQYHNYVELFSGGASVLFAHESTDCAEYLNDLNGEIENFWRVLREPELFSGFLRTVQATPFSERYFQLCCDRVAYEPHPISRAVQFFTRNRMSRSADFNTFATLTRNRTRRGMSEQASAWLSAIEGLASVHDRLKGVVLLNRPALACIDALDGLETVFYADPPYMLETRAGGSEYENTPGGKGCEMDIAGHIALLDRLATIRGKFLLSGYRSEMYDDYSTEYGWNRVEFDMPLASAGGDTKQIKTECIWRNFSNG
jgi:DNA adenine methylase